ncbi:hypothetical protein FDP22_09630 [Paroceanicella profunda]|uniref:Uncharacterized protein n=1 Tax=Paroceanicella profunda TaxID=2579971 RepID=A0A5B8FZE6_9RHOB|nr:hypothetical protein [Paroceanicella profunda]QDL92012.1 hypothetical protein FDP22_09630 [Paroceanicella profunda]
MQRRIGDRHRHAVGAGLAALCVLAGGAGQVAGWQGLAWNADLPELRVALGDDVALVQPARVYGAGLEAPLRLETAMLAGHAFRAWLQLDENGLRQILFDPPGQEVGFDDLVARLAQDWGPAARYCTRRAAGRVEAVEAVWRRPEGTLHAVLLDPAAQMAQRQEDEGRFSAPATGPRPSLRLPSEPRDAFPPTPGSERQRIPPRTDTIPPPRFSAPPAVPPTRDPDRPSPRIGPDYGPNSRLLLRWHDPEATRLASVTCDR